MEQKEYKNPNEIRDKIKSFIRLRGPSLPIHVSKEIKIETLFTSAFLSELASTKDIKISDMKVGGSPLYFIPGQEEELERYSNYLPGKEKEAFLLLKEKKILKDNELEPAIRVALRSIKDFAFPLALLKDNNKILFWRFHSIPELQAKLMVEEIVKDEIKELRKVEKEQREKAQEEKKRAEEQAKIDEKKRDEEQKRKSEEAQPQTSEQIIKEEKTKEKEQKKQVKIEKEKPLLELKPVKEKKPVEKSHFVNNVVLKLITENIEVLEEKLIKKKEFEGIIRVNSDIGKIKFYCIAKDKKSITDNDLTLGMQKSQEMKMPLFFISNGMLNKKALAFLEQYSSMIKFKQV